MKSERCVLLNSKAGRQGGRERDTYTFTVRGRERERRERTQRR